MGFLSPAAETAAPVRFRKAALGSWGRAVHYVHSPTRLLTARLPASWPPRSAERDENSFMQGPWPTLTAR